MLTLLYFSAQKARNYRQSTKYTKNAYVFLPEDGDIPSIHSANLRK